MIALYVALVVAVIILFSIAVVVPEQESYVIERLGKYSRTLTAGFHILTPFIDRIAYKQNLKEEALDVDPQVCITADNVQVQVDGILYLKIFDPVKASYGIDNYRYAVAQLAKTTMRSEIGKLELDRTFCGREGLNDNIVKALDEASDNWGIKVTRYEIQNIRVSDSIMDAMENQMKAEREKRAEIARSVGEMETVINLSRAAYEEAVNISEGEKERMINEAEGQAREIVAVAEATADGIKKIAASTQIQGGMEAAKLTVSQEWINALSSIDENTKIIMSADFTDIKKMTIDMAEEIIQ